VHLHEKGRRGQRGRAVSVDDPFTHAPFVGFLWVWWWYPSMEMEVSKAIICLLSFVMPACYDAIHKTTTSDCFLDAFA
jgi:hypothetical protein